MMKVDEKGERTTITFLGSFFPPEPVSEKSPDNFHDLLDQDDKTGS
jgi:hypothetical protein